MSATLNQLNDIGAVATLNNAGVTVALLDENDNVVSGERPVGYVSAADISASPNNIDLKNSAKGTNIVVASANTETTVEMSMTLQDFRLENVADFLYGELSETAAVTAETLTTNAYSGKMINLEGFLTDSTATLTVTDVGATSTFVEGTDYEVEKTGGIYILETGTIPDASEVVITYDTVASQKVEGFLKSNLYLRFTVRGVNSVTGKHFKTTIYKVQVNPTDSFNLINPEEFGEATVSGTCIASKAISGTGLSQILKHEVVK